jgi:hypothetical protein
MAFNISDWLLRRRIDAQVRTSGRPMEHRRIANPYHAVSVEPGLRCCDAARDVAHRRYLSTEAPMLPLEGCTQASCQCRYAHHDDRRTTRDRRVQFPNPHALRGSGERRTSGGRRITD